MGSLSSFLSECHLKIILGMFLSGYTVAMVTYYVKTSFMTCSSMIWHFCDTILNVLTYKDW